MWQSQSSTMTLTLAALLFAVGGGCGSANGTGSTEGTGGALSSAGSNQGGVGGDLFPASGVTAGQGGGDCSPRLQGLVRDFKIYPEGGHPDFEHFTGDGLKGIVKFDLGADRKPVYAADGPTDYTTGKPEFDQWFRDVPDVNKTFPYTVKLTAGADGVGTFDSQEFFPIDDQGWGNEGLSHNFAFTYELHMMFMYHGGEKFSFTGDDDLWVFVNNRLAIDLGGLHPSQSDILDLDAKAAELGITKGESYALELFQAERHTGHSHFKVQSSLNFINCDPILVPD
jgi:fibro-slime domain-containing protein